LLSADREPRETLEPEHDDERRRLAAAHRAAPGANGSGSDSPLANRPGERARRARC
jgi:hypothetical protein